MKIKMKLKSEITKQRLLQIADHLEKNVPEKQFDMGTYWEERECGSVGCVLGHTMLICSQIKGLHNVERYAILDNAGRYTIFNSVCQLLGFDILSHECRCVPGKINGISGVTHTDRCPSSLLWKWLFGSGWEYTDDNTIASTVKRFRDTVEEGYDA